jgi:hypothetical protein
MKRTKKNQVKQVKRTSDFAIDRHPKCHTGLTSPTSYLYGNSDNPARKTKTKLKRKGKQRIRKNCVVTKKQKVTVKLHTNSYVNRDVPWWRKRNVGDNIDEKVGNSTSRGSMQRCILNGLAVKESSLQHLNEELSQFEEYVKLTPAERAARQSLIAQIQDICAKLFGIERSECRVFGSFAVPSVCTFGSDIDLVIWGLVATGDGVDNCNDDLANYNRSILLAESYGSHSQEEESNPQHHPYHHPNRKKQERVLEWINAIDSRVEQEQQLRKMAPIGKSHFGSICLQSRDDFEKESTQAEIGENIEQEHQKADNECQMFFLEQNVVNVEAAKPKFEAGLDVQQKGDDRKASDTSSRAASNNNVDSGEDDSDDADKLESLWSSRWRYREEQYNGQRKARLPLDDQIREEAQMIKRPRGQSMVSLSSATTCSGDERFNDSGMEVSYTVGKPNFASQISGPTGRNRTAVVNALYKIARRLRPYATTLEVRKKASEYLFEQIYGFPCIRFSRLY